jgi:hypothetical protein
LNETAQVEPETKVSGHLLWFNRVNTEVQIGW